MGALFEMLATLLMAMAAAAFAHLGIASDNGDQNSREPSRVVKRSPVAAVSEPAIFVTVRR
jgi:hypothetical protein